MDVLSQWLTDGQTNNTTATPSAQCEESFFILLNFIYIILPYEAETTTYLPVGVFVSTIAHVRKFELRTYDVPVVRRKHIFTGLTSKLEHLSLLSMYAKILSSTDHDDSATGPTNRNSQFDQRTPSHPPFR